MIGENFCFDSRWLSEFGMSMYDPEDSQEWVGREIDKSDITSLRAIPNHYSMHYADTLTLHFLIMKNEDICDSKTDYKLSKFEINGLRAWLESPSKPTELRVVEPNNNDPDVRYFGVFTNVQPFIYRQECYGLYLTFTCNAPYGFSELKTEIQNIGSQTGVTTKNIFVHTAEKNEGIFPIIKIYSASNFGSSETLNIENSLGGNDNGMSLKMPTGLEAITIDCKRKIVTNQSSEIVPISSIIDNWNANNEYGLLQLINQNIHWIKLFQGKNIISYQPSQVNTIEKVEILYRDIIKSGGF